MKLVDLMEVTRPSPVETDSTLRHLGYEPLGSGVFGTVYGREGDNYVIKIFDHQDTCYQNYLKMIRENPNPCFPKIYGKPIRINQDIYGVKMERLSPIQKGGKFSEFVFVMDAYLYLITDRTEVERKRDRVLLAQRYSKYTGIVDVNPDEVQDLCVQMFRSDITRALDLIAGVIMASGERCVNDVKPANVMLRGKQFVFTDPVS